MSDLMRALKETIAINKETNEKLDLIRQLDAVKTKPGVLELKAGVKLDTIFSNGSTITIASYPKMGSNTPTHSHKEIVEYLICTKGSVSVTFNGGYRILKVRECASIPEGCPHSTTALENNSEMIAICVPAEPAYKSSMGCK